VGAVAASSYVGSRRCHRENDRCKRSQLGVERWRTRRTTFSRALPQLWYLSNLDLASAAARRSGMGGEDADESGGGFLVRRLSPLVKAARSGAVLEKSNGG